AEVVMRLLVLKHLKGWSYEQLEWEVRGSVAYRHFCRLGSGTVPDGKTLVRLGQLLEGDLLRAVLDRVVGVAVERRVTRGRRLRVDTTVVEAPIRGDRAEARHHPLPDRLERRPAIPDLCDVPAHHLGRVVIDGPEEPAPPVAFGVE